MLDHLNNSEVMKVEAQEFEFHVLAPNQPNIDMKHSVMQARGERHQRLSKVPVGKEQMRMLVAPPVGEPDEWFLHMAAAIVH